VTTSWAISGVDLHLDVTGPRIRAGLEEALRDSVRAERLKPGTRLPSSRALASDLGIARNTVAEAYGQLVAEGWLTARRGSGTRVAGAVRLPGRHVSATPVATTAPRYDLRPGSPDLSAFPRAAWLAATRRALDRAPYTALGYSDPRGLPELREALAEYLARARGVTADPEHIVICSGFAQGLWLICHVLHGRGRRTLATEQFLLPLTQQVIESCGIGIERTPVDDRGARIAELKRADALLVTPAHQFPIGVPLAAERRSQALAWAAEGDRVIIEDDYDGEFRYDRHPLGALQARAADDVVYAGTASKTLAPGLRLGWLVVPPRLIEEITRVKLLADRQPATLEQLTLAEFIRSGAYDRHIRRSRLAYRRRRDRLIAALHERVPHVRVSGIAAGLHALAHLAPGQDEGTVSARAAERGLALQGLSAYGASAAPALVIGYATPPEHAFTSAVARLCAVLSR
jgi:GntR family transcriptional regulator / MocR family aminotransferase